ncbi:hypothetical protein Ahy_A10g048655 [Arachis hypogaea]|uniref:Transposase MuDR plant domain-containing protein n=1 Tax=Arachis hypogaea TaxID=3818 RepID=A0A445B5L0_ARAHY|nr:hypothetical protein Ahy_A10g048655 [Arachis hypogaea]
MYWYDTTTPDFESGLHPIHEDKEIRQTQKNKMNDNKRMKVEKGKISPKKKHIKGATKNSASLGGIKLKSKGSKAIPTANGLTSTGATTGSFSNAPISSDKDGDGFALEQFNPCAVFGEVNFEINMEFESLDQFKLALKDFIIAEGRRIFYIKNDERRVRKACVYGEHMMGKEGEKEKAKGRLKAKKKTKEVEKETMHSDDVPIHYNCDVNLNVVSSAKSSDVNANIAGATKYSDINLNATGVTEKQDLNMNFVVSNNRGNGNEQEKNVCPWLIYCAKNSKIGGYQIKTYNSIHTCEREFGIYKADQN